MAQRYKRRQIKLLNFLSMHECAFDTYKKALIKNLVILFVFFCAFEPILTPSFSACHFMFFAMLMTLDFIIFLSIFTITFFGVLNSSFLLV